MAERLEDRTDFYDAQKNSIEWIAMETWERRRLFSYYKDTDFPYIVITANVDVTEPLAFARKHGISFNLVMVYLCLKVIDAIPNYRLRFLEGRVFRIDHTRPMVNHLIPGQEVFVTGEGPWPCEDIVEFCQKTREAQFAAAGASLDDQIGDKLDIINFTSVPWVQYTGFMRTILHGGVDNAPKISFGKYFEENGRILMPVSSQSHHGLMDGRHVGLFYENLQKACEELE